MVQVRALAEVLGTCSEESKSSKVASNHGIRGRPPGVNQAHGNPNSVSNFRIFACPPDLWSVFDSKPPHASPPAREATTTITTSKRVSHVPLLQRLSPNYRTILDVGVFTRFRLGKLARKTRTNLTYYLTQKYVALNHIYLQTEGACNDRRAYKVTPPPSCTTSMSLLDRLLTAVLVSRPRKWYCCPRSRALPCATKGIPRSGTTACPKSCPHEPTHVLLRPLAARPARLELFL